MDNFFYASRILKNSFAILALTLVSFSNSYAQQFWAQKAGGSTIDQAYDVSSDNSGNAYTVGYFTGTASFGSVALSSSGSTDIFITKNDNQGNFLWAQKAGGSGSDRGLSIKTDGTGNSYITGYFNGTATFGSISLTSSGLQDIFIAKYDANGTVLWAVNAGGSGADIGFGISNNSAGDVFVTGSFKGTATFGTTVLNAANTTSDVFTTKLNGSGVFQWTKSGTGNYSNRGVDIGSDNNGNSYVIGQFSDTITFDNVHSNQMQSVIFLIKYNSAGVEQWFKIIGGGLTNLAYGIAVDGTGNSFITGDFTGTLTFFGNPNVSLSNSFTNKVFVAKYTNAGAVQWTHADGSDNDFTSRSIGINNSGSCWITGFFGCKLDEYSDSYGDATFHSVGNNDIYVTKYNSSGTWDYSRNIGGKSDDVAFGVAVNSSGQIYVAGSFGGNLYIPTSTNFVGSNLSLWSDVSCAGNSPYCNDLDYGSYHAIPTTGNLDAFIGRCFDDDREPFDFYMRDGVISNCLKTQNSVCIDSLCPSSVTECNIATLTPISPFCADIAPNYSYSWSPGTTPVPSTNQVTVNVTGTYHVTITTVDGCITSTDSIEVVIIPSPNTPLISDDHGFNFEDLVTDDIKACNPDTVEISATAFDPSLTYWWTGGILPVGGVTDSVISVSTNGIYVFHLMNASGCEITNQVVVTFYDSLPPYPLAMFVEDSVTICDSSAFTVQLYDTVDNPSINPMCITDPAFDIVTTWTITPFTTHTSSCGTYGFFEPHTTGWYDVTAEFVRVNYCYTDTILLSKSVYVTVNPAPYIPPYYITITGGPFLCPGDTIQLAATGAPNYTWFGPGVNGITDSIVNISSIGTYGAGSIVNDTNAFGCTASYNTVNQIFIVNKPQPVVSTASTVICPGDSVLLSSSSPSGNFWEGPNGAIADSSSAIYVTDPGQYFVVVNDSDSCGLVSNTMLLSQYTTPMLMATGDTIICDGDSTEIAVQAGPNSVIEWQPPLSGSGLTQVIYTAGTYTVKITSCGIETYTSITIHSVSALATITASGVLCADSSIILSAPSNMDSYLWMPGSQITPNISVTDSGIFTVIVIDSNGCAATSDTFIVNQISVPAEITSLALGFCHGDSMILRGNPGMTTYQWDPNGQSTRRIVTYQPGVFVLTVTDTNGCIGVADAVEIIVPDTIASIDLLGVDYFCEGDSVVLDATNPGVSNYLWYPGNEQTPSISVYQSGVYAVATVDTFGCKAYSDTIQIRVDSNNLITPDVSNDTTICSGSTISLNAISDSGSIVWYNPMGEPPVFIGSPFSVTVINDTRFFVRTESAVCESDPASIFIETFDCNAVNAPNIFTPNGDGENDYFQVIIHGTTYFNVEIYNRWGTLIYILDHPNLRWDGTMYESGEALSDGTYYFIVNYGKYDGTDASEKGYVTLMR